MTKAEDLTVCDSKALKYNLDGPVKYKLKFRDDWKTYPSQ